MRRALRSMTGLLVFALVLLTLDSALARPSTVTMSCRQAQNLVARNGAVVLSTGRHTYDRFVASPGYCLFGEYAYNAYAPTTDSPECPLGYTCSSNPPLYEEDGGFGHRFFGR